jgi:amino acid transporter
VPPRINDSAGPPDTPPSEDSSLLVKDDAFADEESHKLDQFRATAIAGNDITSSCLYSAGVTLTAAGVYAPISTCILIFVLFLFRSVYSEVCSALPMNGGTYNALLNTTTKFAAALAAVLSMVSYTATAVTSAASAGEYIHYQWDFLPALWIAIGILVFFAALNIMGVSESANSAAFLFTLHLLTMGILIIAAIVYVAKDHGATLMKSFHSSSQEANPHNSVATNIWHGYCAALLGVTGFESSANYIEEQRRGVFPKTLRNMWIAVSIINPLLTFLAIGVLDVSVVVQGSDYSLAAVALQAGGAWLRYLVVIDATLVLSGAVLTSYVGISGLLRRMAFDQLMPSVFVQTNSCRKTNHWIILAFCALTCSLRLAVNDMETLGGVYAIAFLGVMSLCAVANLILKYKRGGMRRSPIVPIPVVTLAFVTVFAGMIGNVLRSERNAEFFLIYFCAFAALVVCSIFRIPVLRFTASASRRFFPKLAQLCRETVQSIRAEKVVFFTKTSSAARLNKIVQYVMENEDTTHILIAHCTDKSGFLADNSRDESMATQRQDAQSPVIADAPLASVEYDEDTKPAMMKDPTEINGAPTEYTEQRIEIPPIVLTDDTAEFLADLEESCVVLDRLYPKVTVELLIVDAPFCPETLARLSEELKVPRNYMFITCPNDRFPHEIGRFGGLRVVSY